jgi:hypothetical protein
VKIRLVGDALTLQAITPDRIEIRMLTTDGTPTYVALHQEGVLGLWEFMVLLMRWQARLELGTGPPDGFDRDITDSHSNPDEVAEGK